MKSKFIILFFLALLCVSCAKSPPPRQLVYTYITTKSIPGKQINQNAQAQIAEATSSTTFALQQLSAIQIATHKKLQLQEPIDPKALGMDQYVSLDWNGPVEPVLQELANTSHYKLTILGTQPPIPLLVNIHTTRLLLADVLRDIGYQIGQKATITVYPKTKLMELRYYSN